MNIAIKLLLPSLLAACLAGCIASDAPATPAEQAVPVRIAQVELLSLDDSLHAVGVVAPRDEVRLSFKTGGVVASIDVQEGDTVREGQVLAVLEQAEMDATLRQVRIATAKAQRDLDRARALYADGVATQEQVQDLTSALQMARANQDSAEFNARFTRIEAPADGVVMQRLAEPRELVAPGQPLLRIGVTSRGWVVKASLTDRDVVRVRVDDRASVFLDAYPASELPGRVAKIAAAADPATGTYEMEVLVEPGEVRLVSGLVARTQVRDGRESARPAVPLTALLEADSGKAVAFVVDRQRLLARRVVVSIGRFAGDRVEVTGGLELTDAVVVEGAAYLRDGDTVRILDDRETDSVVPGSDAGGLRRHMGSASPEPGRG